MSDGPPAPQGKPCPICGKPAIERHRPFCSRRCATIDLARWITGAYRVPSDEAPEDGPPPSDDGEEP